MSYGILFLRVVLGLTMAGHGAQKLFGSFGGGGIEGTRQSFGAIGYRAPAFMALAAGLAEFAGGLTFASGFLTPLAGLAIAVVMLNAIATVHRPNGFWVVKGGYEFNLLIWATALAIAATGPGRFSLDGLLGWDDNISGLWWGVGVLGLSVLVSALTLTLGRRGAEHDVREREGGAQAAA